MLRLNGLAAVLLFVALTAVVALQVVNRLVLHLPIIWSEEAARFLFFWVVLLGAAASVRTRRHFVLDVMPRRSAVAGPWRVLLDIVPDACVLAFGLFLFVQGIDYARVGLLRTATNSGANMGAVYAAIPAFAALTIVYSAINLAADYRARASGPRVERPRPPAE